MCMIKFMSMFLSVYNIVEFENEEEEEESDL